eukprot:Skav206222  [mRNA]  locus=scaffold1844:601660:605945:- [translate_table: standard]
MATVATAPEKNEKPKHVITQERTRTDSPRDSWRLVKIEPEVQDIADHFGLDERITGKLQEALSTRPDPGTDLEVMWEILDEARNPPGLTMIKASARGCQGLLRWLLRDVTMCDDLCLAEMLKVCDRSGFIEYVEIMDAERGLLKFIRDTFVKAEAEKPVPDLQKDRDAWYRRKGEPNLRWDEDGSGELEFEELRSEVVRAFAKSFRVDVAGISGLRDSLREVWCIFDTDNSGSIDRREFMKSNDGLADTVLATMRFL